MAKPTADTDKELIQQIKNLHDGIVERLNELIKRGYAISVETREANEEFAICIAKTEIIEEFV